VTARRRLAVVFGVAKIVAELLSLGLVTCSLAHAECAVDVVIVKGRVEHSPRYARVHVQLVYPKKPGGDSGETTVENGRFSLPIEFLTQSRRPLLVGSLGERCDRRPETVVVTLVGNDSSEEYDRVSLNLTKDFKMTDPTAYTLRSEIVLNGPQ
jgi:hypothetical protein